ncbi:S8 family serine peptidase [Canibacter sp. lx-72]|uniref:S8 family serine peptidase n=1 Tax=Canibacter zhuwentaonis TaxID=2837491 RepID=UPI001BDD7EE8|nr:S8 family serine peptidase [Canibacter zhuwentaonis]MBT1018360.1 S8 family serine peptidase [Canibacter zhuwentaonis]
MTKKQNAKPARVFGGCLAFGLLTSAVFAAGVMPATATQVADAPIVGNKPAAAGDGAMSYAINLAADTNDAKYETVKGLITKAGGATTKDWPEIRTYFAQSKSNTFTSDFAKLAAENGIKLVSAGPTRQAAVSKREEIKLPEIKDPAKLNTPASTADNATGTNLDDAAQTPETTPDDSAAATASQQTPADTQEAGDASGAETSGQQAVSELGILTEDVTPTVGTTASENDPMSDQLWGHKAIGALKAYDVKTYYAPVTVGVIDTGVDSDHPDLAPVVDKTLSVDCTVNGIPSQEDERWKPAQKEYHGTHVAGTIAAAQNGVGIQGVNPRAKIAAIRIYNGNFAMPEHAVCGFMWAGQKKLDVTNNSYYVDPWEFWVTNEPSQAAGYESVRRAVKWSQDQGVLHVAAAGNSANNLDQPMQDKSPGDIAGSKIRTFKQGDNPVLLPGGLPGVINVSAVSIPTLDADPETALLLRAYFSNYGKNSIDVAAPGVLILSTINHKDFKDPWTKISGTSMASPHVAAVASLIISTHPGISAKDTTGILLKHAKDQYSRLEEPRDNREFRGHGLVDALAAVTKDQPQPRLEKQAEYSTDDGATWQPATGHAILAPSGTKLKLRFKADHYVSRLVLLQDGKELDSKSTDVRSSDGETLYVATDLIVGDKVEDHNYQVKAYGYNSDALADDDVTADFSYTVTPAAATPAPVTPIISADTAASGQQKPAKDSDKKLASTGSNGAVAPLLGGVFALLGAGALMLAARRRTKA